MPYNEVFYLESNNLRQVLTPEEQAHLAGGFGATDESSVKLLMKAKRKDDDMENGEASKQTPKDDHPHHLQDIMNEGLASAVCSSNYHTARAASHFIFACGNAGIRTQECNGWRRCGGVKQRASLISRQGECSVLRGHCQKDRLWSNSASEYTVLTSTHRYRGQP